MQNKQIVMLVVAVFALVAVYLLFFRKKGTESKYSGGLPFPGESQYDGGLPFPGESQYGTKYSPYKA